MARPPLENGKKTEGRKRTEYRRIVKKSTRQVTFSKRKNGLWKKASEIALRFRVRLAVVVFSEAGRAFSLGCPSADAVLGSGGDAPDCDWEALEAMGREAEEKAAEANAEDKRMIAVGKKVAELKTQTGKRFWWEVDAAALGEAELTVFDRALQRLRDDVLRHAENKEPQSTPPQQWSPSLC